MAGLWRYAGVLVRKMDEWSAVDSEAMQESIRETFGLKADEVMDPVTTNKLGKVIKARQNELKERAKRLSVTPEFRAEVDVVRTRWEIEVKPVPTESETRKFTPGHIWGDHFFCPPDLLRGILARERFEADLRESVYHRFGLHERDDAGLVTTALQYGLTPHNIVHNWDALKWIASAAAAPRATLVLSFTGQDDERELAALAILTLFEGRGDRNVRRPADPVWEFQRDMADYGLDVCAKYGVEPSEAKTLLGHLLSSWSERWHGNSQPKETYILLDPTATKEDGKRALEQWDILRRTIWGAEPKKQVDWEHYDRDVEIYNLAQELGGFQRALDEYGRRHPGAGLDPFSDGAEPSANAPETIRKAFHRFKDHYWPVQRT